MQIRADARDLDLAHEPRILRHRQVEREQRIDLPECDDEPASAQEACAEDALAGRETVDLADDAEPARAVVAEHPQVIVSKPLVLLRIELPTIRRDAEIPAVLAELEARVRPTVDGTESAIRGASGPDRDLVDDRLLALVAVEPPITARLTHIHMLLARIHVP